MGVLDRYLQLTQNPSAQQGYNEMMLRQQEQPQVDSGNAIGSLAELLGPTPAEREAAERRMQKNQAQMSMWTGLFDGLRQLGNLYFTAKGAVPQKFDNPYQQVNQQYQQQRQLYNDMANYRRQYATSLYSLRRQMEDDARRNKLADAQANWYNSREEVAREKAELEKYKAAKVIKMPDGSLWKHDPVTGTTEQLKESDPLYAKWKESQVYRNYHPGTGGSGGRGANNGTYGYVTRTEEGYNPNGTKWKETRRVPTTGNQPRGQEKPTTKRTEQKKTTDKEKKGKIATGVNWKKK